ncbi:MAG: heme o synthase [Thermaerobacter sp.]|nr:heme o synthase [Thermaerobacter sp.]
MNMALTGGRRMVISDFIALMKPRIIVLLLITAYCAMVVAAGKLPSLALTAATLAGLGLSTGGAHAVNMWYDQDIDRVMRRTRNRPVAAGRMRGETALAFGIVTEAVSFGLLGWTVNWMAAAWSLAGFLFYVFVYTIWLKRRTPQNIVIGGAAGAFPPLVGWAAVTGQVSLAALIMFLIIFLWTPPHFWALALYKQEDYRSAGIPMMPVARGPQVTKWQSLGYSVALLGVSLLLYWTHVVTADYLVAAAVLGVAFIGYNLRSLLERAPQLAWAKKTFRFSLVYMALLFTAMVLTIPR